MKHVRPNDKSLPGPSKKIMVQLKMGVSPLVSMLTTEPWLWGKELTLLNWLGKGLRVYRRFGTILKHASTKNQSDLCRSQEEFQTLQNDPLKSFLDAPFSWFTTYKPWRKKHIFLDKWDALGLEMSLCCKRAAMDQAGWSSNGGMKPRHFRIQSGICCNIHRNQMVQWKQKHTKTICNNQGSVRICHARHLFSCIYLPAQWQRRFASLFLLFCLGDNGGSMGQQEQNDQEFPSWRHKLWRSATGGRPIVNRFGGIQSTKE